MQYVFKQHELPETKESFNTVSGAIGNIDDNLKVIQEEIEQLLKLSKSMLRETLLLPHYNREEIKKLNQEAHVWSPTTQRFITDQHTKGSKLAHIILLVLRHVEEALEYYKLTRTTLTQLAASEQVKTDKNLVKVFKKFIYENDEMRDRLIDMQHMVNGEIVYNRLQSFKLRMNEFTILSENIDHNQHFALNLAHSKPDPTILKKDEKAMYRSLKQLRKYTKKARRAANNLIDVMQDNKKSLDVLRGVL